MQQLCILLQCTCWHQIRCNMTEVVTVLSTHDDLDFLENGGNIDIYRREWSAGRSCQRGCVSAIPPFTIVFLLGRGWVPWRCCHHPGWPVAPRPQHWRECDTQGTVATKTWWNLLVLPGKNTEMLLWLLNLPAVITHKEVMQIEASPNICIIFLTRCLTNKCIYSDIFYLYSII